MTLRVSVCTSRLYNGKLSLYASLTLGRRTSFVSRWDTERVTRKPTDWFMFRGRYMTLYGGSWTV